MKYKDLSQLLTILGYVDPYPNAGKWNKKAQKARRAAIDKLNIEQYRIGKVGLVNGLEGGLTIDYTDIDNKKECRFILGFTELGYWIYCNTAKENLK